MKLLLIAVAVSVFFVILAVEEVRQPPLIDQGPVISARPNSAPERFAIVEPRAELQLVKGSAAKPQNDEDAFAGVQPAWEILVLAICVFAYLYLYDLSHTITVIGDGNSVLIDEIRTLVY